MPLYEYECLGCRARVERRQRLDEAPLTDCPHCGQNLRRVLYPAGVIFRGSGWYCTDSRPRPAEESKGESHREGHAAAGGKADAGSKAPVAA